MRSLQPALLATAVPTRCRSCRRIKGSCGYIEFSDSAAAQSALLFDQSNFVGQQINVELCDDPIPEDAQASSGASEASEEFEKVEKQDVEPEPAPEPAQTEPEPSPTKPSPATATQPKSPAAKKGAAATPVRAESLSLFEMPSFACFRKVLQEPINDVHAVLGLTLVGLAALTLY